MADNIESISYINLGDGQNHPIDAVTVNGQTIPDITGHPYRYSNINLQNFSIQRT